LNTVLTGALVYQKIDGDDDGEQGTFFVTRVLGLKPTQALQMSFRLDFYMGIVCPASFTVFCVVVLNPKWDTGLHVLLVIGILIATLAVMVLAVAVIHIHHWVWGIETSNLSFVNIIWKFRRTASMEVKRLKKIDPGDLTSVEPVHVDHGLVGSSSAVEPVGSSLSAGSFLRVEEATTSGTVT